MSVFYAKDINAETPLTIQNVKNKIIKMLRIALFANNF